MMSNLTSVRWNVNVILICVSCMTGKVEHFFSHFLLITCISFFETVHFISPFSHWIVLFFQFMSYQCIYVCILYRMFDKISKQPGNRKNICSYIKRYIKQTFHHHYIIKWEICKAFSLKSGIRVFTNSIIIW